MLLSGYLKIVHSKQVDKQVFFWVYYNFASSWKDAYHDIFNKFRVSGCTHADATNRWAVLRLPVCRNINVKHEYWKLWKLKIETENIFA